ncbi:MAG: SBBP repeat-containing protein [Bryobacteraceae bacterium]|nr:SBBP repeat-containing protein [Bryobacteraceae bacterium]
MASRLTRITAPERAARRSIRRMGLGIASLLALMQPAAAQSLSVSSYLGGPRFDHIRDVAFDSAGNLYAVGGTESPSLQYTNSLLLSGIVETSSVQQMDVFVAKFDASGRRLWTTVIGGPNYDRAYAVEVDSNGYVYVAGRAGAGFPVTSNAFQKTFMGGSSAAFYGRQDGFLLKLSPSGNNIVWSTYFGGADDCIVRDLAVDSQGNVVFASGHITGKAFSSNVQAVFNRGPYPQPKGGKDAVVGKVKADGSQLLWAMHLGGAGEDSGEGSIRLDGAGNPVLVITTTSTNIPTTTGAYSRTYRGSGDFYVAKVRADGTGLIFGTYLGGSSTEMTETHNLAIDKNGNIFIGGGTKSTNFPIKSAFDGSFNGNGGSGTGASTNYPGDGIVAKLSPDGKQLLASTYLGGRYGDQVEGIVADAQGNIFVTGATYSDNFPTSANAYQRARRGPAAGFLAKLSNSLNTLLYSTYVGGSKIDYFRAIAVHATAGVAVAGETKSLDFPLRNAFQSNFIGVTDGAFSRFTLK